MADYTYNDNEATMPTHSAMLTSRMGDETGRHDAAYLDTIQLLASVFSSGSMIDIGCGMGRVTQAYARKLNELVALEPDKARCNWTRELVADIEGVAVLNLTTHDYIARNPGKQFDLAVLGMVLQHLPTHYCPLLMEDVAALTRRGGIAIVSTTHTIENAGCFTYQHAADARLSEEEFNRYAEDSQKQDKGVPVRRFSRAEFEALVPDSFEIALWNQYSYYRSEYLEHFAKLRGVDARELAGAGNSQFVVLKKT